MDSKSILTRRMKGWRSNIGLSQAELSDAIQVSSTVIGAIERYSKYQQIAPATYDKILAWFRANGFSAISETGFKFKEPEK